MAEKVIEKLDSSSIVASALTPTLILNYSSASIPTAQSASSNWWSEIGRNNLS